MQPQDPKPSEPALPAPENPEAALRDARQRFIAAFPKRSDSIGLLLGMVATLGPRGPLAPLRQIVHRTAGLAGTLGFPNVSIRARELEEALENVEEDDVDTQATEEAFDAIQAAFAHDLSHPPDWVGSTPGVEGKGRLVLLVEDDEEQREAVSIHLNAAGFETMPVPTGDRVVEIAASRHPDIIVLDANLPGLDGFTVCRLLKTNPLLAGIPVIFLTVRAGLDDRLVGLMLGADDYLVKPVEVNELLLRMQLLLTKRARAEAAEQDRMGKESPELDYESFSVVAHDELAMMPATLVLVHTPAELHQPAYVVLRAESRRRDLVARYDESHIILLMAEMSSQKARERVVEMLARFESGTSSRLQVGLASSPTPHSKSFEALLAEADEGILLARERGALVAMEGEPAPAQAAPPPGGARPEEAPAVLPRSTTESVALRVPSAFRAPSSRSFTVLLADDDPEVSRLLDVQLKAAGFKTLLAADGVETLAAVERHKPDAMVINLTMTHMAGLEVLAKLAQTPGRPPCIVLSARGREQDVTRAFALGADDYVTKPFSPQELLARVKRLLR